MVRCGSPQRIFVSLARPGAARRPGTHNSKYGEPRECHVVRAGKLTEVETLAELYEQPLFEFKPKANGHVPPSPPAGENTDAGPVDAVHDSWVR